MVKVLQLTVEVGKCVLPSEQINSTLDYQLLVELTSELSAATSIKSPELNTLNFGTRLFIRLDKLTLDKIPQCSLVLFSIDSHGNRSIVAKSECEAKSKGVEQFCMDVVGGEGQLARVQLQFGSSYVQAKQNKSKNNRSVSSKSNVSQKQSSCDQKQMNFKKMTNNFHSMTSLDNTESQKQSQIFRGSLKVSKVDDPQNQVTAVLDTSIANSKQQTRTEQTCNQTNETAALLALQVKIDQLQQKITMVSKQLRECNCQLEQTVGLLKQEKKKSGRLEMEKEELSELLGLEQMRSKIANDQMNKIIRLIDQMTQEEKGLFAQIQEKDQIIMLNQELQHELDSKKGLILNLQTEINSLKDKIIALQIKSTPVVSLEPVTSIKKLHNLPGKQLQKVKSQKRLSEKRSINHVNKRQQDTTKQTNNSKEQSNKPKQANKVGTVNKRQKQAKPPVRGKAPSHRNEIGLPARMPKGGKPNKIQKNEQKSVDLQKKSQVSSTSNILPADLDSLQQPTNLMLDSRTLEPQQKKQKL